MKNRIIYSILYCEIIDNLNKEEKMTVIMISHDIKEALNHASKVLYMGSDNFYGSVEEFQRREK